MSEFDSPWKEALDRFLPLFLQFFFPQAYDDIDWNRDYEALDKELAQIMREAESGGRLADKLFKVWRKNGDEAWVLIHIEIQAQVELVKEFTQRIYTYNYRIFDRFSRPVATLVVLGDEQPNWRPKEFGYNIWETNVSLKFPIVKLLDYQDQEWELEQDENPFALIVLAHLQSLTTKDDGRGRQACKVRLIKNLLNRGLSPEDIRQLFRVIDWLLDLPEELSREFWDEIQEYQEANKMPVITSTEQLWLNQAREEGRKEGRQEGKREGKREGKCEALVEGICDWLQEKFGKAASSLPPLVKEIKDVKKLRVLQKNLWAARSVEEAQALLSAGN